MKAKKQSALSRLMKIAGTHKYFSYASCVLAAISAWVALIPFYDVWRIIKEVLEVRPDYSKATHITAYGWQAVGFALLAAVWVMPIAFVIALTLRKGLKSVQKKTMTYKLSCLDGIQEGLETIRDLRSNNMTEMYMEGLNKKIKVVEKNAIVLEFKNAARLANCTDFIEKLPDKWNTMIGENGSELSGGERQRISIARAFLKDAPIILMDEATASLDVDNESVIQESISKLIQNKTVLIIAHRMRTVDGVDQIIVLKDGVVAEQGTPSALKEKNGIYKHMVDVQLESEQWKYN